MTKRPSDWGVNEFAATNTDPAILSSTLFGIPITQLWTDLMLWERFLNAYHPAHLIELGTGRGGLSLFLALEARARSITFATVDTHNWTTIAGPLWDITAARYVQGDAIQSGRALVEEAHAAGGAVCVMCDNGNKPLEFKELSVHLKPGDYIAVHDWGNEFMPGDTAGLPVVMLDAAICEAARSITRWFKVVTP